MRIGHVELFVRDTEKSKKFYADVLGFEIIAEQPGGMVWLKLEEMEVLLRPGKTHLAGSSYAEAPIAFALYVKDLGKAMAVLGRRGLEFTGDDGEGCPTFRDPDGHWFQICNPSTI